MYIHIYIYIYKYIIHTGVYLKMGRPAIRALPDSPAAGDAAPTAQHGAAEQRGIPGRPCGAQSFGAHGAWEMDGL